MQYKYRIAAEGIFFIFLLGVSTFYPTIHAQLQAPRLWEK